MKNKVNEEMNPINKYIINDNLKMPDLISPIVINQKPEKIKSSTSENIDVPTMNEEITEEQIIPNAPLRKDVIKPYIIKDSEDIEDINKKSKEPITKIDIKENIYPSKNIELQNPNYDYNLSVKENKIPNIINIHKEVDLIDVIMPTKEEEEKKVEKEEEEKKEEEKKGEKEEEEKKDEFEKIVEKEEDKLKEIWGVKNTINITYPFNNYK